LARGLGLRVMGTLGVLIENLRSGRVDKRSAKKILNDLNGFMYLSSDVYTLVLDIIDNLHS
jgi:predicted nucleic acid-binding protein